MVAAVAACIAGELRTLFSVEERIRQHLADLLPITDIFISLARNKSLPVGLAQLARAISHEPPPLELPPVLSHLAAQYTTLAPCYTMLVAEEARRRSRYHCDCAQTLRLS